MAVKNSRRAQQVIQNVASLFSGGFVHYLMPVNSTPKPPPNLVTLPSGFRSLDKAVGLAGLPRGYLTELIVPGPLSDSSGTVCIATRIAAKAQQKQQVVTIVDLSHQFDTWLAERCGLVAPQLLLSQPDTLLNALLTLEKAARNEGLVLVVTGVISEALNQAEPQLLKLLLRRLRSIIQQSPSIFIFVTTPQEKDPLSPTNYPPGFPLADLAAIRLWVQAEEWTYQHGLANVYKATLTVIKNQLAAVGPGANIRIKFDGF